MLLHFRERRVSVLPETIFIRTLIGVSHECCYLGSYCGLLEQEAAAAAAGRGRGIAEEEEGDGDAAFEPDEGEENEATLDDEAADDDDEDDDAKKGGSGGAGAGGRRAASSGTSRAAPQRDQDPDAIQAAIESTAIRDDDDYDD